MQVAAATQSVLARNLTIRDWIVAGVIFTLGAAVGLVVRRIVSRAIAHGDPDRTGAEALARMISYVIIVAGLVYALSQLGVRLGPLLGALGIGGLALAFAAQSILSNFLASVLLQLRRPFHRQDQIETVDTTGIVEDINFRTVVIRTFDGQRVFVPCASVLSNPITNHSALRRRRTTLRIGVGYGTDLSCARQVILDGLGSVSGLLEHPPPEAWVQAFGDSTIELAVRYWHAPDNATLWRVRSEVAVAVKEALDGAGIEMPFPQRQVHLVEGPVEAGPRRPPTDQAPASPSPS